MRITILRHAYAGHKGTFDGPDEGRLLDARGERDAENLVAALTQYPIERLVSSPATRCIQTLGPLAEAIDLPIELWDGLGPDADSSNLVECLTNPKFARAVLCTHGEVMSPLLRTAAWQSLIRDTGRDGRTLLTKGTAWRLHLTPKGKLFGFKHVVPIPPLPPKRSSRRGSK
jgi:phosphohistidine phosphatase SixA